MIGETKNQSHNKTIGDYGEMISTKYLINKGFQILSRNYRKKWGEIDIVAHETNTVHFIEVKTVSYETKDWLNKDVSRGNWRPEDNIHPFKLKKLSRAIESWILESNYDGKWQIDAITVKIVLREKYAVVKYIDNIIL